MNSRILTLMWKKFIQWHRDNPALILVLVAIVVIAILLVLGPAIGNVFSSVVDQL